MRDTAIGQFEGTTEETGPSIQLIDGSRFYLLHPRAEDITIETIAHATSRLCRFTGHVTSFYSVAQHCIIVSRLVPPELALTGLLHDATEAYIGDLSRPLKDLLNDIQPGLITDIEGRIHEAIAERYSHEWPFPPEIKMADNVALATEKRDLVPGDTVWEGMPQPAPWQIVPLEPEAARIAFLARFAEIVLHPGQGMVPVRQQPDPHRHETTKETSARIAREEEDEKDRWEVIG